MRNKNLLTYLILVSSLLMLSGCDQPEPCKPQIIIKKEIVYVKHNVPKPVSPPKIIKYNMKYLKLNQKDYYIMTLEDGDIMLSNWKRYKNWGNSNYKILKKLSK